MAFRIETAVGALLLGALFGTAGRAQPFTFTVRHEHLRKGGEGVLRIAEDSISFEEAGKSHKHSRVWKFDEIQQITLSSAELQILTYEDQKWKLGRDREYNFDRLPKELATSLYPFLRQRLDRRFIVGLSDSEVQPVWRTAAKLTRGRGGVQGVLTFGEDRIVFDTSAPGESRTWRYPDVENIATSGPFDLAITTLERSGWARGSGREFRFQLKQELSETVYNDLWRRLNQSKMLPVMGSRGGDRIGR
jgi:hypothetical protein